MKYLEIEMRNLMHAFPDVPIEALKASMIAGIEAYAWQKDGVSYVGTTGKLRRDAIAEIMAVADSAPSQVARCKRCEGTKEVCKDCGEWPCFCAIDGPLVTCPDCEAPQVAPEPQKEK